MGERRWLAPLVTSCAVAAVALLPGALPHGSHRPTDLAPRSADSLLLMLIASRANDLSGTIKESADLGLPNLPTTSTTGGTNQLVSLLTGSHTIRLWQSGSDRQRISILDRLEETDFARRGSTVWTYQSSTNTTTLGTLNALAQNEILRTLFQAVLLPIVTGPDSVVTVGPTDRIAGRNAYTLVIRPKRDGSLVDRLELAIDAEQGTLLRFRFYARDTAGPAIQARFTDISYNPPAERLFAPVAADPPPAPTGSAAQPSGSAGTVNPVSTVGYGWSSVVKIAASDVARSTASTFAAVTQPMTGGRFLATPLLSVLVTDQGDVYLGTVPVRTLIEQAGL